MPAYGKRPPVKKRSLIPEPVSKIAKDVAAGFGELQRQTGSAVEKVKEGVRKVRKHLNR